MSSYDLESNLLKKYGKNTAGQTGSATKPQYDAQRKTYTSGSTDSYSLEQSLLEKYSPEKTQERRKTVSDWASRYDRLVGNISSPTSKTVGGYNGRNIGQFRSDIDSLIRDYDTIKDYAGRLGIPNAQRYLKQLQDIQNFYGQFESQEDYDWFVGYQQDLLDKRNLDLDAYDRETRAMETRIEELRNAKQGSNIVPSVNGKTQMETLMDTLKELQNEVDRRKQYFSQAQRVQKEYADSERFANIQIRSDFAENSGFNSDNQEIGYRYINADTAGRLDLEEQYGDYVRQFGSHAWDSLDEEDKQIYNYLMNTGDRQGAAEYLRHLEETLQYRKGEEVDAAMDTLVKEDPKAKALRYAFMANVGYNQHLSGMQGMGNLIAGKEDYVPPSSTQVAGQLVREDLREDGRKLPEQLGGGSTGQMVGDLISTTANMVPSILASRVAGMVGGPVASKVATGLMMGGSAGGSAYQEMINEGYSKEQARLYGLSIGAAEGTLEAILGGISSLGGGGIAKVTHWTENLDNALLNFALRLGGAGGSEALEEGLQEMISGWIKSEITHEYFWAKPADVLYSSLMGFLSGGMFEGPGIITDIGQQIAEGRNVLDSKGVAPLKEIAQASTDQTVRKTAGKITDSSSAFAVGNLARKAQSEVAKQNSADLAKSLSQKGMPEKAARQYGDMLSYMLEAGSDTEIQRTVMESDPVVGQVLREAQMPGSMVHQRLQNMSAASGKTISIDRVASLYGKQAAAVKQIYNQGQKADGTKQDVETFAYGFQRAFTVGRENGNVSAITEEVAPGLTQSQRELAYDLGRDAVAAEKAAISKRTTGTAAAVHILNEDGSVGDEVRIAEISSRDGDSVTYVLEDGRTVSEDQLSFSGDNAVLDTVKDLGLDVQTSNVVIRGNKTIMRADTLVAHGIDDAYRYGSHGYSLERLAKDSPFAALLTEEMRTAVYNAGKNAPATSQKNPPAVKVKTRGKTAGIYYDAGGGDVKAYRPKQFGKLEHKRESGVYAAQVLQKLGIGVDFYFFKSYVNKKGERVYLDENGMEQKAPNGWYDKSDSSIHIDLNAGNDGQGLTLFTMAHELTHFIEQWSQEKYKVLADFLIQNYEKGQSMDELVLIKQQALSAGRKKPVSYEEAYSEVIADSMESMLADGNVMDKLQELKAKDSDLVARMKEFFDRMVKRITKYYQGLQPESEEGQLVLEMKDQFKQIQQLFAEALTEASENFQAAAEIGLEVDMDTESVSPAVLYSERTWRESDYVQERMYSERKKSGEYGGIREVLAKQGLDELSVKLGDRFPLSAKFDEAMKNDHTELVMETVTANGVRKGRKESAYKVGRKAFTSKFGAKTRIHIAQMDIDADLYADVANESINKAIGNPDEQSTLDVIPHIDKILSNSILMGIERIAHTDNKGTALYGYRLYNLYWYVDGNKKTPHALVCTVVQDLTKAEGYVFKNIENVTIGRGLPGSKAGMSSPVNGDTYTVAQLYDAVKKIDRNDGGLKYSDSDRHYLFHYTHRNDGVAYQERATGTSNRDLLAGAFEDLARSPAEMEFLQKYQENIGLLNEQEAKLQEIRTEIRELTFGKGPKDPKRLEKLQEEAGKTANRIHIYDKKLLQLEAAKPLRDVLDREREKVRKATRQKGQEALAEYREKRKESAAKKDARRKIRKTVMELDKLLNRGDKKKNVKSGMTSMVDSVLKLADALFMDEYTNRDMLHNGVGVELTDAEEKLFREAQQILQKAESGAAIEGMEFTSEVDAMNQLKKLDQKLSSKMAGLKDVFARERKRLYGTTVSDLLGKLADEYSRLSEAEDGAVRAAKDENVYAHLLQLQKDVGGTTVRDMTLGQMEAVADAFTMVLTTVRNANKMFAKNLKFKRDTLAAMVMGEIGAAVKKVSKLIRPGKNAVDTFSWNNLKPVYAFERLGSETLKTLYQNIRSGQDVWSRDMQEADDFRREQYRKHNRKAWDLEKQHRFEFESGIVELSLEQIMSLYAYSRREQALDHLLKGGFVFSGSTEVMVKEHGIQHRYLKKDATAYNLTADELLQVVDTLTKDQKAFVEEMQTYLSDVMGGKGNEISLQMYGIKSYGEKNYFPIRSAGQYMERAKEDSFRKEQGQISIVNSGFTKSTTPKANNPITLDSFMNVWAEHVNEMSMYHGFALPMEDFRRVYNYSSPNMEVGNSQSVNAVIENAFGKAATGYIDQLYKDLNGGALTDNREGLSKKLVGLHKKAAVFASASVVVQQPSAIVRAFALIDPRHFIGPKVDRKRHKQLWEEVKKYAPVAFVKEMGYFDTGMGRSARDFLQAEEYSGIREKMAALFKDTDYRDEILGKAPALADELTWCSIWEAVKRETKVKNPTMDVRSDAFLQIAGARFSEVIDKTQVYDSVLSRSANMRSKSGLMNMVTSFLAEPTTSINMLEDALRKGDRKQLKRTVGAVYGSVLLNSLLVSLVYAARDDDEDETYWEKYLSSVAVEMMDGINPITYYPILRDIWSIGQGFDVERADMTLISDFADAAKKVIASGMKLRDAAAEEKASALAEFKDSLWSMTDTVASLTGLPVKNIRRDIEGARNMVRTIQADLNTRDTTKLSLMDAVLGDVMNSIPIGGLLYNKSKRDRLYGAIVAKDSAYVNRLKAGYETDAAYHSAIKLALRDHDSRIWEAAVAWNNNDLKGYMALAREIIAEGNFIQDDVVLAIRAEASSMVEKQSASSSTVKGYFTNEKFGVAMGQNNTSMADIIREDLIDTKIANGKTREEAEESVKSTARSQLRELFETGAITASSAVKMLVKYGGYEKDDAADKVAEWKYEVDHPELNGRITFSQYQRWETDGKNRGIALETYTNVVEYRGGNTSSGVRSQEDVAGYINSMPISTAQKDALWCCFWSESTLYKNAPWRK